MSTKYLTLQGSDSAVQHASFPTTLMIQNITGRATSEEILGKISDLGFDGTYDFFHIPQRYGKCKSSSSVTHHGYAFINFKASHISQLFMRTLQNTRVTLRASDKALTVCYAHVQGVDKLMLLVKRSVKKNPAAQPWFEKGLPGLLTSGNPFVGTTASWSDVSSSESEPNSTKHVHCHDGKVSAAAHAVLRMYVANVTMKEVGIDMEDKNFRSKSCGGRSSLWRPTSRLLPDFEPMIIPVNTAYFGEDPSGAF
eukprot:TRINITY_DN27320_c0_g1_i5.p1 TRINITY_DN27320_c0_g1~~TRINITY_DN27320_c0_g1_i5.p1  ORF type:complete len:253 (+),score=37.93 TRINITY_DN27320_c0_g1_i5:82-840(+)